MVCSQHNAGMVLSTVFGGEGSYLFRYTQYDVVSQLKWPLVAVLGLIRAVLERTARYLSFPECSLVEMSRL